MTTRFLATTLVTLAAAAATTDAAHAIPQVTVDRACYVDTVIASTRVATPVAVTGTGFTPGAQYQVSLDEQPIANGTNQFDEAGGMTGTFTPPATYPAREKRWQLRVDEGSNSAITYFRTSDVFADFSPARGLPATLKVRWVAYGMTVGRTDLPAEPSVYLHYLRPGGKHHRTVRLGRATGVCGRLKRTDRRRLFPFKAKAGLWRLQVDANRTFVRGVPASTSGEGSPFPFYTLGVRISKTYR